ncbi:CBO0543 family protein [Brevibacillus choshinensis]|uniref:Permease n=1 Tax=Brevibacillus choshinensis TaxID=54911 RepID=A0ABX7FMR6_BRECH|nr:CBO0543 family protein [Brevibacillus choshinensis]QRG66280.1 hypothetical protein JNE38_22450 [Brevibacillus choshinensis]
MLVNILFGFLIPWFFGIWLFFKNPKVVLTIAPFSSAISFIVNIWGTYYNFWLFTPLLEPKTASMLPADIGLFPVAACFNIHFIQKKSSNPFLLILMFSIGLTLIETGYFYLEKVSYYNGWNFIWTFFSYLTPALLTYGFFYLLKTKGVLEK